MAVETRVHPRPEAGAKVVVDAIGTTHSRDRDDRRRAGVADLRRGEGLRAGRRDHRDLPVAVSCD